MPFSFAICAVLSAGTAVTYSSVDLVGHARPVRLLSHGAVHATLERVVDQGELIPEINETMT